MNVIGHIIFSENKFESALIHYERSVSLVPDAAVYPNLARLYHHFREDRQLAERYFQKALEVNQNATLYCDYALLLLNQNKWDEAIVSLMAVTFFDDGGSLTYGSLEKKHLDKYLQQEIDSNKENLLNINLLIIAYNWLIHCYHQSGNVVEKENTLDALKAWVEKNPQSLYYRILSYIYEKLGQEEAAEIYCGLAFSLDTAMLQNNNGEDKQKPIEAPDITRIKIALNRYLLFKNEAVDVSIEDRIMQYYCKNSIFHA